MGPDSLKEIKNLSLQVQAPCHAGSPGRCQDHKAMDASPSSPCHPRGSFTYAYGAIAGTVTLAIQLEDAPQLGESGFLTPVAVETFDHMRQSLVAPCFLAQAVPVNMANVWSAISGEVNDFLPMHRLPAHNHVMPLPGIPTYASV